jgi:hypothetical protein
MQMGAGYSIGNGSNAINNFSIGSIHQPNHHSHQPQQHLHHHHHHQQQQQQQQQHQHSQQHQQNGYNTTSGSGEESLLGHIDMRNSNNSDSSVDSLHNSHGWPDTFDPIRLPLVSLANESLNQHTSQQNASSHSHHQHSNVNNNQHNSFSNHSHYQNTMESQLAGVHSSLVAPTCYNELINCANSAAALAAAKYSCAAAASTYYPYPFAAAATVDEYSSHIQVNSFK